MKTLAKSLLTIASIATAAFITSSCDTFPTSPAVGYHTGREVRELPAGYHIETIGGTRFYTLDGIYYRPRSGRYVEVESPY